MPRRKRKISPSRKPPLEFEESPVSIPHGVISPVFASDNPAKADVIPIDHNASTSWVSPQFIKGQAVSSRITRAMRRRRNQSAPLGLNHNTAEHSHTTTPRKKKNSKIKPLRFAGEKTPDPPSPIEELTYDESHRPSQHDRDDIESSETSVTFDKPSKSKGSRRVTVCGATDRTDEPLQLLDTIYGIQATGAYKRLRQHQQEAALEANEDELPQNFTDIKKKCRRSTRKKGKRALPDLGSDASLLEDVMRQDEQYTKNENNDDVSIHLQLNTDSSDTPSPVIGTQKRPRPGQGKGRPTKRLFDHGDVANKQKKKTPSKSNLENTMEALSDVSAMQNCHMDIRTPEMQVLRHFVPPQSARVSTTDTEGGSPENVRHKALSKADTPNSLTNSNGKHKRVKDLSGLDTSTPPRSSRNRRTCRLMVCTPKGRATNEMGEVLVYDTPEEEYGVSVRQRRLRQWRKTGIVRM